jgi:hypothetical protein
MCVYMLFCSFLRHQLVMAGKLPYWYVRAVFPMDQTASRFKPYYSYLHLVLEEIATSEWIKQIGHPKTEGSTLNGLLFFGICLWEMMKLSCALRRRQMFPCLSNLILKGLKLPRVWHINLKIILYCSILLHSSIYYKSYFYSLMCNYLLTEKFKIFMFKI